MSKTYKDMRDFVAYKATTPTTKIKTPSQKPPKRPTRRRNTKWFPTFIELTAQD